MARKKAAPADDKPTTTRTEQFSANLRCVLTAEEIADRADRAAQCIEDRDHVEEEMKASQKHSKAKIDRIESEMRQHSNEVRTRSTYRDVDCERVFDFETKRVREIRTDTGEVTSDREMTEREKQMGLFDGQGDAGGLDDDFAEGGEL